MIKNHRSKKRLIKMIKSVLKIINSKQIFNKDI